MSGPCHPLQPLRPSLLGDCHGQLGSRDALPSPVTPMFPPHRTPMKMATVSFKIAMLRNASAIESPCGSRNASQTYLAVRWPGVALLDQRMDCGASMRHFHNSCGHQKTEEVVVTCLIFNPSQLALFVANSSVSCLCLITVPGFRPCTLLSPRRAPAKPASSHGLDPLRCTRPYSAPQSPACLPGRRFHSPVKEGCFLGLARS